MQEKIQKDFHDFNICPNILHADADTDADAGGIAITLLHLSAGALKMAFSIATFNWTQKYLKLKRQRCLYLNKVTWYIGHNMYM